MSRALKYQSSFYDIELYVPLCFFPIKLDNNIFSHLKQQSMYVNVKVPDSCQHSQTAELGLREEL